MDAGRTAIGVCLAIVVLAAIWDFVSSTIPNLLTFGGIALGIALRVALGYTDGGLGGALRGLGWALVGTLACGAIPMMGYARGDLGGGDVKLFAAIGALAGPVLGYNAQAWTYGILLLTVYPFRMIRHGVFGAAMKNLGISLANTFRSKESRIEPAVIRLPRMIMGPVILAGTCVAFTIHGVFR